MNAVITAPAAAHHWTGMTFAGAWGTAGVAGTALGVTVAIVPPSSRGVRGPQPGDTNRLDRLLASTLPVSAAVRPLLDEQVEGQLAVGGRAVALEVGDARLRQDVVVDERGARAGARVTFKDD